MVMRFYYFNLLLL